MLSDDAVGSRQYGDLQHLIFRYLFRESPAKQWISALSFTWNDGWMVDLVAPKSLTLEDFDRLHHETIAGARLVAKKWAAEYLPPDADAAPVIAV